MSWLTSKSVGDLAEKQLCRWFQRCGLQAMRHEGAESFDITVQATVEVKHDLRAASTGHVAIEISTAGRSSLLTSPAAYWAHVVGDEAILVRTEVLRQAVVNGPWRICQAGDGRRRKVALVPVAALKEMEGAQVVGNQEDGSQRSEVRRAKPDSDLLSSDFCLLTSSANQYGTKNTNVRIEKENLTMDHFIPQPLPEYGDDENTPEAPGGVKLTVLVSAADVKPKPVRWLWLGKVAIGKLTLVAGEPGAGKSFVLTDLAARVSRRELVGGQLSVVSGNGERTTGHGHEVLLWNTHDELADTIRPRLDAAGADVGKITVVQRTPAEGPEDRIGPPRALHECRDVENLEVAIDRTTGCRLVVIDTLPLRTSGRGLHREARRTFVALADLARRRNVAVVAVVDLPQAPTGAGWQRSLSMLAAVPEVRAVWNIIHDREQPGRRLMLPVKNNLEEGASGLAFRLASRRVEWESEEVRGWGLGARGWGRPATGVEDVGPGSGIRGPQSAILSEAVTWLREALADGPLESKELLRLACENGFSSATLRRVKQAAGVVSRREGFGPGAVWRWELGAETVPASKFQVSGSQQAVSAYGGEGPKSKVQGPASDEAGRASLCCNPQSNVSAYGGNGEKSAENDIGAQEGMSGKG